MTITRAWGITAVIGVLAVLLGTAATIEAAAPESKRLIRARDYIADEQWSAAIETLQAAVNDPKETRRDEALYWLAHSHYHSGDPGTAVATISRLERQYPKSMWVKPGQALRIEIAVRLQRSDVLWYNALPPPPPPAPAPVAVTPRVARPSPVPPAQPAPPAALPVAPEAVPPPPAKARAPHRAPPAPKLPPPPPPVWYTDSVSPDADIRIQALGGLMRTDADKVIPILGEIAFESDNTAAATRAVFMLAQSPLPKARETVVKVAKTGPEPVKIAAVRDLGRFGGSEVSQDLLQVYATANEPVKWQVLKSLGEREESKALYTIVTTETNFKLRSGAIVTLGRAGGVAQLASMYASASAESRRSIIDGLFQARAEMQLIKIAENECAAGNASLCGYANDRLKLLGTPKAREYLLKVSEKR